MPGWGLLFFSVYCLYMAKESAAVEEYEQLKIKQGFQAFICKG